MVKTETKETKTRKNPDYSNTIVNQTNANEVKVELSVFYQLQLDAEELRVKLEKMPLFKEWTAACAKAAEQKTKVAVTIDIFGSYQDVENGVYGLIYNRTSKQYHAQSMIEKFPREASIAVEQAVNVKALEGLLKGKILTEEELKKAGVITETQTPQYYIH